MPAESTTPRRLRRLLALTASAAATALVALGGGAIPLAVSDLASPVAAAAAEETSEGVRVNVAPAGATSVSAGAAIDVVVEIVNRTDEPIDAGTVALDVATAPLSDRDDVDGWTNGDPAERPDSRRVAERATASLAAGAATTLTFTIPADATGESWPVIGVGASLSVDGAAVAGSTAVLANSRVTSPDRVGLALAYPLTTPPVESGLIPAERLEAWTAPTGALTRQLEAVDGAAVAIGLDPRIPASIRVLGSSAPESAVDWLAELERMPNEVFPLAYADADLAAQSQAGVDAPLEPLGFADAIDPVDFSEGDGEGTATASPGEIPDAEALLDWSFTRTDIAWPADDTVASGDLDVFAAGGLTTAVLAPGNVDVVDDPVNAAATIEGRAAVVADHRVTPALRAAADAASDTGWRAATSRVVAELALAAGADGGTAGAATLLGTFARSGGDRAERVAETLAALASTPWSQPATLVEAVGAPPVARTLASLPESQQRLDNVGRMLAAEQSVEEFSDVLADPELLTAPTRRDLLALLSTGWIPQPEEWTAAVGRWLVDRRAITDAVSIVPSSTVLVVASETGIPITILNALPYPVEVTVTVAPSNGRLIVEDAVDVTVEAETRSTVSVPVAAGVGSGEVALEVSLASPDGTPVGDPVTVPANVQADWEGVGAAVLAAIAVAVFAIGVLRSVRRRRRDRAAAAGSTDAADAPAASASTAEPSAEPAVEPAAGPARKPAAEPAPERPGAPEPPRND
ncbi:DUF6049 family protein [Agromyces sp. ZXT2-6]|uniref:DUF6049 family protein n=1 Tax=Agromyces sp. ZXT2-6 TaxID=3461153 RepID=UPI004054C1D5